MGLKGDALVRAVVLRKVCYAALAAMY